MNKVDLECPRCKLNLSAQGAWLEIEASWHPKMWGTHVGICPTCQSALRLYEVRDEDYYGTIVMCQEVELHEDIEQTAKTLGLMPSEIVDILHDARSLFRREAGLDRSEADAVVWRVLDLIRKDTDISSTLIRARIATLLLEELELKSWFYKKWTEQMEKAVIR